MFADLEHPRQIFGNLTPNWYASIMGTGIVAVAAATLPQQVPGLRLAATVVWAVAAVMLIALTVATVLHWRHHRGVARGHLAHPVIGQFYGAPPMAMLTGVVSGARKGRSAQSWCRTSCSPSTASGRSPPSAVG